MLDSDFSVNQTQINGIKLRSGVDVATIPDVPAVLHGAHLRTVGQGITNCFVSVNLKSTETAGGLHNHGRSIPLHQCLENAT